MSKKTLKASFRIFTMAGFCLLLTQPTQAGRDGGGGEIINTPLVDHVIRKEDVERLISDHYYSTLKYLFFFLENKRFFGGSTSYSEEPLFQKEDNIYASLRIPVSSFIIQKEKCQDPSLARDASLGDLHLRDACAIGSGEKGKIIISLDGLNEKLNGSDWKNQALALLAHEASHLSGLGEEQAKVVERDVLFYLKTRSLEMWGRYLFPVFTDLMDTNKILDELTIERKSPQPDRAAVCGMLRLTLQQLARSIDPEPDTRVDEARESPLEFVLRPLQRADILFASLKVSQLYSLCEDLVYTEAEKAGIQSQKQMFKKIMDSSNADALSMSDFFTWFPSMKWSLGYIKKYRSDARIKRVKKMDEAAFDSELESIKQLVKGVLRYTDNLGVFSAYYFYECVEKKSETPECQQYQKNPRL